MATQTDDLLESARQVERVSKDAAEKADFFAPERGRYIQGLQELMTGGRTSVASDPSYGSRYEQGRTALESSLAAQGLLSSGRAGLELQKYGQELASSEFQNQYKRLLQLAGVGQSNPTAAASMVYQGTSAPSNATQSIANQVFQLGQDDKDRAARMAMMRLDHEHQLDQMRFRAQIDQENQINSQQEATTSNGGGDDYSYKGGYSYGGRGSGVKEQTSDEGFILSSLGVPVGETYKKNVRANRQATADSVARAAAEASRESGKRPSKEPAKNTVGERYAAAYGRPRSQADINRSVRAPGWTTSKTSQPKSKVKKK